jgi:hypothetical protein
MTGQAQFFGMGKRVVNIVLFMVKIKLSFIGRTFAPATRAYSLSRVVVEDHSATKEGNAIPLILASAFSIHAGMFRIPTTAIRTYSFGIRLSPPSYVLPRFVRMGFTPATVSNTFLALFAAILRARIAVRNVAAAHHA